MSNLHDIQFPNESADYRHQRMKLLEEEIELRKKIEDVAALRRQLPPGGELKEDYVFDEFDSLGKNIRTKFSSLFEKEKNNLLVYSFMYAPGDENACPACTSMLDGLNGSAAHIRDKVNFVVVGKAPLDKLNAWASKRNWSGLRLLSSFKNSYNHDYFGESADGSQQMPVMNVFTKNDAGIVHTYSTELLFTAPGEGQHPRHADLFWPIWALFDLTPEGRGGGWFPKFDYE